MSTPPPMLISDVIEALQQMRSIVGDRPVLIDTPTAGGAGPVCVRETRVGELLDGVAVVLLSDGGRE